MNPLLGILLARLVKFARLHRLASECGVVGLVDRMKLSGFLRPVRNPHDTRATVLVPARMAADMVRGIVWPLLLALDLMNGGQQLETWLARDDAFSVAVLTQALELYCE